MIRVENLVHQYPVWESQTKKSTKTALDGISLDIPSGQFVAVLGPNGCGKSTLARHLNALLLPDGGGVYINGKSTADVQALWEIRKAVGMVFQNPDNQIIGASVEEDTAFGPENRSVPPEEIRRLVAQSLAAVGLSDRRRSSPGRLSGGQKQRVAVAGAIASETGCLVLDEPTAMLDPQGRREVMQVVRELNRKFGITVILITHHMDEAVQAGRVVVMHKGNVLMDGTPREIFTQVDTLRAASLTVPQTIEVLYDLDRKYGADLPIDALSVGECADILETYLQ